ncbi:MAG TPA: GNAT family N-acetyltransferase [Rummeliibacillus sp.]|nr:GNAT family N-acetyltransferase [Rummeliibacillus sp.]
MKNEIDIKLIEANSEDKNILENLFQYYLHDLSEYTENLGLESDGRFDITDIELFITQDNLLPIKILLNNEIIGFIFLIKGKTVDYVINDMFILRKFRSKGLGKVVTKIIFDQYKGSYAVMQLVNNKPAITFWHTIYHNSQIEYEENEMVSGEDLCLIQKFKV